MALVKSYSCAFYNLYWNEEMTYATRRGCAKLHLDSGSIINNFLAAGQHINIHHFSLIDTYSTQLFLQFIRPRTIPSLAPSPATNFGTRLSGHSCMLPEF